MTEWKKGISDKEIEKTDKMVDDLIDMIDDKRDDLSLDFITNLTKYFKNLLKSEKYFGANSCTRKTITTISERIEDLVWMII